jgi:hypothetical protein
MREQRIFKRSHSHACLAGAGTATGERYEAIRAKIAEADADPRPSLTEEEVDRHFEARLKKSLMARGEHD